MLDQETKKAIDSARDILVGKVPDPKSQVEQITMALIYKFMDYMDKQSQSIGLKASFFQKEWKRFSWTKLIDKSLSGQDRINLYKTALEELPKNPHMPKLFRDIFKNAYLPFNDPETLNLFLKEIDAFSYENSENLGSAYEYLLSILGSQKDAGQFRTPRHIINFIVSIVAPKKHETILDPACGTAGFLISAFKYIYAQNAKKGLTPHEKNQIAQNLAGYDIEPNMIKLALANMYLHGFLDPKIYEYDSLTSADRWDESFDIILANPPFMTPKGGIRPHNKFSVQSKHSEVLFVDYIAEHLKTNGRAGIIVPAGIASTNHSSYKHVRKHLVEDDFLCAAVSLPQGVFNPYSPVKTFILFLDRKLAKTRSEILFVDIENDGFDLGAKRRPIDKNDIPQALETVQKWMETGKIRKAQTVKAVLIDKKKIAESGNYALTSGHYAQDTVFEDCKYEMVKLEDACISKRGESITKSTIVDGDIPVIAGGQKPAYYCNKANHNGKTIAVSGSGAYAGFISFWSIPVFLSDSFSISPKDERLDITFLYYILRSQQEKFYLLQKGAAVPHVYWNDLKYFKIPFPPLSIQKQIVAEIEGKQKAIEAAQELIARIEAEREKILQDYLVGGGR